MPKKSYFARIFPWLLTIFIPNLCFLCFCGAEQRPSPRPIVLLPSFFHWEATNRIFVSPNPIGKEEESVDISVRVQSENENGQKNELFFERQKSTRGICAFKVFIPKKDPSGGLLNNFYIKVEVSGHRLFDSVLAGTSDLRQMFIQTDKVFYRPGERVNVRALPLTSNGLLYTGPIQFQLLDQKSFRIFNKTSGSKSAQTDGTNNDHRKAKTEGFLAEHFDLPKFLRFGEWKIVAFAVEHTGQREMVTSNRFQRSIHVREYIAPKFHVFLDLVETITTMSVKSVVSARFAHGMPVSGELTLRCSSPNALNISEGPSNGDQSAAFLHSQKKLLSTEIIAGIWSGKLDLSNCLGENRRSTRIQISAEVFERGTLQAAKTQRDFDPFWSAFELIPMRPAFTEKSTKLLFYLRPLSSLQFVINGRAEMVAQCISEDKALNGLNQSSFHKLGTMAELEIKPGCIVYIIRARRELPNGNFSIAESLIIPALNGTKALDFSLIADQTPQNRVDYFEGEVLEARVPSGSDLNYAMICNGGRDIILVEKVGQDGRILIPISARMRSGPCVLYVFGKGNEFVLDMRLFFVHTERCPDQEYSIGLSSPNVTVGAPLDVNLRALPDSLALLHAYDSRLEGLLSNTGDSSRTAHLWSFSEFLSPDPPGEQSAESFAWFSNLIELAAIFAKRKEVCRLAGKLNPQCPLVVTQMGSSLPLLKASSSRLSDDCLREMEEECERQKSGKERADTLTEMQPLEGNVPQMPIKMAGNVHWLVQRPSLKTTPSGMEDVKSLRSAGRNGDEHAEKGKAGEELSLRDFFPEVWLFNDYRIENGSLAVKLNSTPHSVTAWNFVATFWSLGRADVCKAEKQSLVAQKHVFMDVDVPLHVYVNESVNVHIAVSVVNLTRNEHMSVCFRGLSPKVCGDVGRDGSFGETDFTRVVLTPESPIQLKNFFVRFLRPGTHNLSFELRSEDVLKGHDWHCRGDGSTVYDRISKQIQVERRVDVEEHFRQIVVYRRKRLDEGEEQQMTLDQILDSTSATTAAPRASLLASAPDVISYSVQQQQQPSSSDHSDQQSSLTDLLQTKVSINAGGRKVYNLGVEFSKFVPSFPPALSTELLSVASPLDSRGNAPLHRVRNRPVLNAFSEEERSERNMRSSGKESTKAKERQKRRRMAESSERPLQGYSLPNLLKELAFLTYELKSVRTMLTVGAGAGAGDDKSATAEAKDGTDREWTEQRELLLGTLLSELLTFSDCEHRHKDCGFGEFGRPKEPTERSLVLTTLATSLLCEQRAAEEYICGPIAFLAREARTLLNGTGSAGSETDFGGMGMDAFFNDPSEQRLFLESLFVQAVMDCSAYACAASPLAKESWKQLHSSFYRSVDLNKRYDIRVIAALAYMSTAATRSIMRSRLATATLRDDTAPFWGPVEDFEEKGTAHGVLERSVQKSSTVLANALALLAYTREHSVYRYWKNEFDFDALSNWLVEQQDSRRQYENALDSFFASRALFQFVSANAARQARQALLGSLQGNFSIASSPSLSRQFNANELPFSLSVSPSASTMQIETKGEAKLLLGVRVLMEKRRRSRRDPNDVEPVTLSLAQSRTHPNFVLQTVTIISHSQLIRAVQIEHGLFTGFTSRPHLVQIMNSSVQFQAGPRVSLSAVHFVLSNLIKEEAVVYTVTLIEPENPYAPTDLAPIAITANHHHLTLGQLIVLPDNLDFGPAIGGVGSLDSLLEHVPQPRLRRSKKHRRSKGRHQTEDADKDGQQFSSSGRPPTQSFLTQLDAFYPRTLPTSQPQHPFMQMMVLDRSRQPSPDIIETVCLRNGVCTCAETTCTLRCSSCARLTFREICQNIYSSEGQLQKFALTFRLNPNSVVHTVKIAHSTAEYTVLDNVRVVEWRSSWADQPELLTIWIRKCNIGCLNVLKETSGKSPRFMLIGNPQGLFDEGDLSTDWEEENGDVAGGEALAVRAKDRMVRTHYVMYDSDRLLKSTDCHELFGRVADESCSTESGSTGRDE